VDAASGVSTASGKKTARYSSRMTAAFVKKVRTAGRSGDGDGLYLIVDPSLAKRWVLRVQVSGRRRDVGLGGTKTVTLAQAREIAHDIRSKAKAGDDPVAARRAGRDGVPSFEQCAKKVHSEHLKKWRPGSKSSVQWLTMLERYAFPVIGSRAVNKVESADILKILVPIWLSKPETGRKILQRVRTVFDHAAAGGYRSGENPCRLAVIGLPKQGDTTEHFAALPYAELPKFMGQLRDADCSPFVKLGLEFLILTATRSGEVRGASSNEFDLDAKFWTIPKDRTKTGKEHVVPLCDRAIRIFHEARKLAPNSSFVFLGRSKSKKPLSDMSFTMVLRRLNVDATAHGFRSTFRDWVSEETDFPGEVAEMALAHAINSKVEAAYRRGKLLQKRRQLMNAWAIFALGTETLSAAQV
jgi:integrase